ncbi:RNA recognition motif domain-containing protein [Ditylenchus destructor]|nr:RNA recognition motif domain-containing protein [Ditylenchus destructor]
MFHSRGTLRLVSYFRPLPIHFNHFSNNHAISLRSAQIFQSKAVSIVKRRETFEKFLNSTNLQHWTSQIYTRQSFTSSLGSGRFDESRRSERDARTVMVANLSKDTTEDSLRQFFRKKSWNVTDCKIIRNKQTGTSRQFGFVELATVEERLFIDCKVVSVKMSGNKELDDKYRIFVGGLSKETSRETLHEHFSKFGDIFECHVVYNEDNLSQGFGFVTYTSQDSTSRALADRPHRISGKLVFTHLKGEEFTLLLYDLPSNTTDKDLEEMFSKVAKPVHWQVIRNRKLNANFPVINGYVSFSSAEEVDRVMERQYSINGSLLTIQRQLWKGRMRQ